MQRAHGVVREIVRKGGLRVRRRMRERERQRVSLNGQVGKQSGEVDKSAAELVKAS